MWRVGNSFLVRNHHLESWENPARRIKRPPQLNERSDLNIVNGIAYSTHSCPNPPKGLARIALDPMSESQHYPARLAGSQTLQRIAHLVLCLHTPPHSPKGLQCKVPNSQQRPGAILRAQRPILAVPCPQHLHQLLQRPTARSIIRQLSCSCLMPAMV